MDRKKTKKALQDAMKKIGNAPRRKVSGMSPGERKAKTGSATGRTTREKVMDAFRKAKTSRPGRTITGGPVSPAKQLKSRGMSPAQARNQVRKMGPKAGPAGMRKIAGMIPMVGAGAPAMNKAVMKLVKKIKPTGRPGPADVKRARALLKQAMQGMKKGK